MGLNGKTDGNGMANPSELMARTDGRTNERVSHLMKNPLVPKRAGGTEGNSLSEWLDQLESERPLHPRQLEIAAQIDRAAYERTGYVREWKQLFLTELAHNEKGKAA